MLPPPYFPPRLGRLISSLRHSPFFGLKYTTSFFYSLLFWSSNTANPPVIWLQIQQVREGKSHPGVLQAWCDQYHLLGDHQSSYGWDTASGAWKVQQFTLPYSWWRQVSVQTRAETAGCLVHWKQSGSTWGKKNPQRNLSICGWYSQNKDEFFTPVLNVMQTSQAWNTTGEEIIAYLHVLPSK